MWETVKFWTKNEILGKDMVFLDERVINFIIKKFLIENKLFIN